MPRHTNKCKVKENKGFKWGPENVGVRYVQYLESDGGFMGVNMSKLIKSYFSIYTV